MGLEIGWHLRFAKQDRLEARFDRKALPQVDDHLFIVGGWNMDIEHQGDAVRAVFTRKAARKG